MDEIGLNKRSNIARFMHINHITTINAVILAAALTTSCSKRQNVTPHITVSTNQETNVTTVTTNGHTFKVGKITTNNLLPPKPSP